MSKGKQFLPRNSQNLSILPPNSSQMIFKLFKNNSVASNYLLSSFYKQNSSRRTFLSSCSTRSLSFRQPNRVLYRTIYLSSCNKMADNKEDQAKPTQVDLSGMRKPYRDQDDGIEESQLPSKDPIKLFEAWFNLAKESGTVYEPNAFCICTADKDGQPSARMVLLKGFGDDGFRFFTHYTSQKGRNIAENPKVSMLFYWDSFNRQVRVEGKAQKLPEQLGEDYFKRRPQSSQIGAAISDQCSLIESREALMKRYDDLKAKLGDKPPEKPTTWGGYLIVPERFEFWQGNTNRVHDRIMFRRPFGDDEKVDGKLSRQAEKGWIMERMLP